MFKLEEELARQEKKLNDFFHNWYGWENELPRDVKEILEKSVREVKNIAVDYKTLCSNMQKLMRDVFHWETTKNEGFLAIKNDSVAFVTNQLGICCAVFGIWLRENGYKKDCNEEEILEFVSWVSEYFQFDKDFTEKQDHKCTMETKEGDSVSAWTMEELPKLFD